MNSSVESKQPSEYQDTLQILMEIPFFAGLPLEALKLIAYFCRRETFKPGEFLFREDEVDPSAYYVLSGTGTLLLEQAPAPLQTISEGRFIGGLSLVGDMKRLFSLRAEQQLVCIVLTREKFRKTLDQFPNIIHKIMETVAAEVYQWEKGCLHQYDLSCAGGKMSIGVSLL